MGTQVQCKSYLPGYYSMRDLNEDSNSSSWPLFYERTFANGQYCNGYVPRTIADSYPGYDKDKLKQKMLEHEAVFKTQVYELHRLYRIQRDMMEEVKRTESNKRQMSIEPSSSSSLLGAQKPVEDAGKWHPPPSFLLPNSGYPRSSVSGAEIVNSPLSCTKGNKTTPCRADGSASKDCEVLEARPSKVRKKLFDLQLPADEYIDTEEGEQLLGSKVTEMTSSLPNGNHHKVTPEKFGNFFLNGEKNIAQMNASASTACPRSTTRLADLNEPIQVEDDPVPSSVNFLGYHVNHGKSNAVNISPASNSVTVGLQKGAIPIVNKSSERDWLSGMHESGEGFYPGPIQRGNSMISPPPGFHHSPNKASVPSQPAQVRVSRSHPPDYGREEMWRGRAVHGSDNVDRGFGNSNVNHLNSVMASQLPGLYSFGATSDVASWSHSALSWGKSTGSLSQKMGSLSAYPSLQSCSLYSTSSNSSSQIHGLLGEKLQSIESSKMNGFYHGSSSGSMEILGRYPPFGMSNPVKDMDLNVVLTKCPSDEVVCLQDLEAVNRKTGTERDLKGLPWLRAKTSSKSEAVDVGIDINSSSVQENEHVKDLNKLLTQENNGVKKIMGVAIFEKPAHSRNEPSFLAGEKSETEAKKNGMIDINVACDEQIASEALADEKSVEDSVKPADNNNNNTRSFIDLNCCFTEDDDEELSVLSVVPSVAENDTINVAKILKEIDLEAPAVESEDDVQVLPEPLLTAAAEPESGQENDEEVAKTAAESIVALSLLSCPVVHIEDDDTRLVSEHSSSERLLWFADIVSRDEMDDFELMTLQMEEVKEEDFLPKPFIPEALKVEDSGTNAAPSRTRKGQSRRGRPRRDFQRDILPGLASLSRHEVTEDLQTFGGLMRATGQPWNSTLTRRNGGGRGRRRAVVADAAVETAASAPAPAPAIEVGLEDRSLTGWGKTTRRPRRQRCPGGNPPPAALLT